MSAAHDFIALATEHLSQQSAIQSSSYNRNTIQSLVL